MLATVPVARATQRPGVGGERCRRCGMPEEHNGSSSGEGDKAVVSPECEGEGGVGEVMVAGMCGGRCGENMRV